jgi:hypothetical protein
MPGLNRGGRSERSEGSEFFGQQYETREEAIRSSAKPALIVRLYENDTKALTSVLYDLSGGRVLSSSCLKSVPCFRLEADSL